MAWDYSCSYPPCLPLFMQAIRIFLKQTDTNNPKNLLSYSASCRNQLGIFQRQPLRANAAEFDLDPRIRPLTLAVDYHARAKFGVDHVLPYLPLRFRRIPHVRYAGLRTVSVSRS